MTNAVAPAVDMSAWCIGEKLPYIKAASSLTFTSYPVNYVSRLGIFGPILTPDFPYYKRIREVLDHQVPFAYCMGMTTPIYGCFYFCQFKRGERLVQCKIYKDFQEDGAGIHIGLPTRILPNESEEQLQYLVDYLIDFTDAILNSKAELEKKTEESNA